MATFSQQDQLPSLIVPKLNETLDKYLLSAKALVNDKEYSETVKHVEDFRRSDLARQLQLALENRAKERRNWLSDWWYDAYTEIREPLVPYLCITSMNSFYSSLEGSQVSRAADIAYHWMKFWQLIRSEKLPITRSRGEPWDMHQYKCLFNSTRVPAMPKDLMMRYFCTESEGSCPSHIIVLCAGNIWKVEMLRDGQIKSQNEIYKTFEFIRLNSSPIAHSVVTLTSEQRDIWAKERTSLIDYSILNEQSLRVIEEAAFAMALTDTTIPDETEFLESLHMCHSHYTWVDKCFNLVVHKDGQMGLVGDHSNVDGIVVLHGNDDVAQRVRKEIWKPEGSVHFDEPTLLQFELNEKHEKAIDDAQKKYDQLNSIYRGGAFRYFGYGNELLKKNKLYADTVVQIVMQLSFRKTHGKFAPIYETASTRRFYHGRTETVRGCTVEMVEFGNAVMNNKSDEVLRDLFKKAYDAHNNLMTECSAGRGIDRHLLGLRNCLVEFNKGCSPKRALPAMFRDKAWSTTGGNGNFLLSTSFLGYMLDHEDGGYGFVTAMRPDGYGTFYRIGRDRFLLCATDFKGTESDLAAYGENCKWAFDLIGSLIMTKASI